MCDTLHEAASVPPIHINNPDVVRGSQSGSHLYLRTHQVANWGEMTSLAAKMRGASGVIIDGAVTDVVEIRQQGVPTLARAINQPLECGGVMVHPGDLVVAGDNGIVIMPPQVVEEIYPAARMAEDRAPLTRRWLQHGGDWRRSSARMPLP
jgi:regulator of RNase E activity RraA